MPEPPAAGRAPSAAIPLLDRLTARIEREGPLDFAAFMAAALYDDAGGYYAGGRLLHRADFRTSPEVHPGFGVLLARQTAEMLQRLPGGPPRRVVELGPGSGALAASLLPALADELDRAGADWGYHLVEVSAVLRAAQRERLASLPAPILRRVCWSDPADLAAEPAAGVVLANEFFDALPVRRVRVVGSSLREIRVGLRPGGGFLEDDSAGAPPELVDYLGRYGVTLAEGQEAEIGLEALAWIDRIAAFLPTGFLLVIDYGHPAEALYAPQRARGTLLAYREHRATEAILARVGEQDLTAHVNFTALARRGQERGFRAAPLRTQTEFLLGLGVLGLLAEDAAAPRPAAERLRSQLALKELFAPGGMGETFRVQVLGRGAPLEGLQGLGTPWRRGAADEPLPLTADRQPT